MAFILLTSHKRGQKSRTKYSHNHRGSALLVAMIIMGILMTIAIGVSEIVIQSVHDSRQLIDRTTAWYRAESGIETALDKITKNAPGFQVSGNENSATDLYDYSIVAASNRYPVEPYLNAPFEETYADLPLGQTINIPLFSAAQNVEGEENAEVKGITEFKLQYYLNADLTTKPGINTVDLDIIRWKIFGKNLLGESEVINGLVPDDRQDIDGAQHVSCLGTAGTTNCFFDGQYFVQDSSTKEITKDERHPIDDFLRNHTENFLAITNMINVDMMGNSIPINEKKTLATIKYKLIQLPTNENDKRLTLPTIKVTADGFEKNTKQSIDIEISRERSLPVFNYALYKTK